jgi:hypothetical protein
VQLLDYSCPHLTCMGHGIMLGILASCCGCCACHTAAAAVAAGWSEGAGGSWVAALAAHVPLRQLQLCEGSVFPGDTAVPFGCPAV